MTSRTCITFSALFGLAASLSAQSTRLASLKMQPPKGILGAKYIGDASKSQVMHLSVCLPYRDSVAVQNFVEAVSNPKSPQYRQFIAPEVVGERFGLATANVDSVARYLTSNGMKIRRFGKNRLTIMVDGTVAQVEAAFHTKIETFAVPAVMGKRGQIEPAGPRFAYVTEPSVPAAIAPYIVHVGGMEDFTRPRKRSYDTPTELRTTYGVAPLYQAGSQGQGRTIGISSYDGFDLTQVDIAYQQFSLPIPPGGVESNISVELSANSYGGAGSGFEEGEADLDIQATLGMAPLANVIVYDGGFGDVEGVLALESDDNTCDVITESYGWPFDTQTALACHNLHLSLSAQGITYMCASGDEGTALGPYVYPDQDPEVLMVGGTKANVSGTGTRISEPCWSDFVNSGASGGGWWVSNDAFNTLPSYQHGTGVPTDTNYRLIPDVALNADPATGYEVFIGGGPNQIGGTSGASPTFTGSLADAEESIIAGGGLTPDALGHRRLGRIADLIYSFNGDPAIFFDVTTGATTGILPDGTLAVPTAGWDYTTGWGAMKFDGFVKRLLTLPLIAKLSESPTVVEGGSTTKVTGTVTLAAPAPAGGTSVVLSSSDPSVVVPFSVPIAAGASTATFAITTKSVAFPTSVRITAAGGSLESTTITVDPPRVTKLAVSPTSTVGGAPTALTGTVTVAETAPAGGLQVLLGSNLPTVAQVPIFATVPAGKSTGTFPILTFGVAKPTVVSIGAVYGGEVLESALTVNPAAFSKVVLSPTTVVGGTPSTVSIVLTGAAPAAGLKIALTSSNTAAATVPATVTIAGGMSSGSFTVTTKPVSVKGTVTVTTTLGTASKAVTLTLTPNVLASVRPSVTTGLGGVVKPTITVTLTGAAGPGGNLVTLSASPTTAATFASATATVPAGAKSVTVALTTLPVSKSTTVVITATSGGISATTDITLSEAALGALALSPTTVVGGSTTKVTGTVTLTGPAGPGGIVVTLASSNKSAATVPASVTVPANATSVAFTVTTLKVTTKTTAVITSTFGVSKAVTLTVSN